MDFFQYSSFDAVPERCHTLFSQASASNIYLSESWFRHLTSCGLEANATLYLASVEDEKTDKALLLLPLRSPAGQNGSRFAKWRFGARTLASMTNFQCSYFAPILDAELADLQPVFAELARGLSALQAGRWHVIDFNLMDAGAPEFEVLRQSMEHAGYRCRQYFYKGNWFEEAGYSAFSDYLASRTASNKKQIQNYQRKLRRLEKKATVEFEIHASDYDLDKILRQYKVVYDASWKQEDFFPDFFPELVKRCAENGSLRFLVISVNGRPAAFEFVIVTGRQCVFMRTAYDADHRNDSMGSIVIMKMIEYLIEVEGVSEWDFGLDDDSYKAVWLNQRRERSGLVCFNRNTLLGNLYLLKLGTENFSQSVRDRVKSLIQRLKS